MNDNELTLNPNPIVQYLKKHPSEFTREDIMKYIEENGIEFLNFRYVGEDGKLKTLNFVINSIEHLETLFATGERVDGSSFLTTMISS